MTSNIPEHEFEVFIFELLYSQRRRGKEGLGRGEGETEEEKVGRRGLPVLDPTVGAVETTEPSVILYINVVFPALSRLYTDDGRGDQKVVKLEARGKEGRGLP